MQEYPFNIKSDRTQLPFVLELLDDESPVVRREVVDELLAYGARLDDALLELEEPPNDERYERIQSLLLDARTDSLRALWSRWGLIRDDLQRLEAALSMLTNFVSGHRYDVSVPMLLDDLADEYTQTVGSDDPRQLSHFLFRTKGLHGEREDYYSPLNGSLAHTIIEKRGLPISLCSIFILVGARLGMDIQGINLPGHFITQAKVGETTVLVDCFNDGQVIEEKHITEYAPPHVLQSLAADADTVIQRALKNLVNSYEMIDDIKRQMLMRELLGACEAEDKLFF